MRAGVVWFKNVRISSWLSFTRAIVSLPSSWPLGRYDKVRVTWPREECKACAILPDAVRAPGVDPPAKGEWKRRAPRGRDRLWAHRYQGAPARIRQGRPGRSVHLGRRVRPRPGAGRGGGEAG